MTESARTSRKGGFGRKCRAFARLLKSKMVREKMPPGRVAAGWAIGMFVGCAIPFGLQLVVSIPLAIVTRTSKVGATVATFITNPVTIFFIYPAQTWVVYRLLFGEDPQLPSEWTFESVKSLAGGTIASFFIGGVALGLILSPIMYFVAKRTILEYRKLRDAAAARKEERTEK